MKTPQQILDQCNKIIRACDPNGLTNHIKESAKFEQLLKNKVCLWHKQSDKEKHMHFGDMLACTHCMEQIHSGYCSIDVRNFDIDMIYYFQSFWSKVEIKGSDECWPWKGGRRLKKNETVAYMPSPFHSAKTQSAPRVAFWLSRGYTGKLRITHKEGCATDCCNPLHLKIKGVELLNEPKGIETINFSLKNLHDHARDCRLQE